MYVHPHLTPDGTPIPGYSVPLYFYSEVQYAMPGELYGWE
jgi:conjugative transfer region lipoprotein (TIGR03751 family)